MRRFRERLLARLVERRAISHELARKLVGWTHPGFSAFAGEPIPPGDTRALEDMASYLSRNRVSLKRLLHVDGQQAVIYRALKPNPRLGQSFVALEWLARVADQIPDPGRHRTLFYAAPSVMGSWAADLLSIMGWRCALLYISSLGGPAPHRAAHTERGVCRRRRTSPGRGVSSPGRLRRSGGWCWERRAPARTGWW